MRNDALQGTLDLLILKTLRRGTDHNHGITCSSIVPLDNQLRVEEGSLYPALRRLEVDGLIEAEWRTTENKRRARYYQLTRQGAKRVADVVERWREHTAAVSAFLRSI